MRKGIIWKLKRETEFHIFSHIYKKERERKTMKAKYASSGAAFVALLMLIVSGCVQQSPGDTSGEGVDSITIENFAFTPKTITVSAGTTVTWTNLDSADHTVTSESGDELDSGLMSQGDTYSKTFDSAGTYDYYCTLHPYMTGTVLVEG